jgi:hypothetical protein
LPKHGKSGADGGVAEHPMRQILFGIAIALLALATGCTQSMPKYQFSCENHNAIDAGFCDDPAAGRLVSGVLTGGYTDWR